MNVNWVLGVEWEKWAWYGINGRGLGTTEWMRLIWI